MRGEVVGGNVREFKFGPRPYTMVKLESGERVTIPVRHGDVLPNGAQVEVRISRHVLSPRGYRYRVVRVLSESEQ
jgi:hypothetical protein